MSTLEATVETETMTLEMLPALTIQEIKEFIPHRYPFLLVDRVTEHAKGVYIEGYKNLTANEAFFEGHFPHMPVMPGVLQVEALAQIAGIMVAHMPYGIGKLGLFAGLDNVRFRRMVVPGDRLDLRVEILQFRKVLVKVKGIASVNGETSVEADMMFSLMPKA
jgi:3-hydroxyacyl-[acyl-carrier-protein] dehydratase